jgi:hypothetical protein
LKRLFLIVLLLDVYCSVAQKDTLPFNRKEEIVFDAKRYRKWNNYLTIGVGKAYSDIRRIDQAVIGLDFQFHVQRNYFQAGFLMTGDNYLKNSNVAGHLCFGKRIEKNFWNFAGFIGPSYSYFVTGTTDSTGLTYVNYHSEIGGYLAIQAVYKVKYDVGIGLEIFADISQKQKMAGGKVILYFSGAYRGVKKGFHSKKS